MGNLNAFRLSYETAFLFVLSYEYNIPFPKLLGMYDISDKVFWAYMSLFTNMSKMGVRKGNQLSKIANRIYKNIRGIKDKTFVRTEVDVTDEDGNLVYDDKGNILPCFPNEITIIQGSVVGAAPLPFNIGIGIWSEEKKRSVIEMVKGLEKNKPLPATGIVERDLKTSNQLRPGVASDILTVPVYQTDDFTEAEGKPASHYEYVADVVITGDEVDTFIPENSLVNITLKADSSEQMKVEVHFLANDITIGKTIDTGKKHTIEDTNNQINKGFAEADALIETLEESGINVNDLKVELASLRTDNENTTEKKEVLKHLRDLLRKIEKLDEGTEWQRVERELREEFDKLEKAQDELGDDNSSKIVEQLRTQTDNAIRAKDVQIAREVLKQVSSLFFQLTMVYQCMGIIRYCNDRFGTIRWKDSSRARQLTNRGMEQINNNPTTEGLRQIAAELLGLMPKEDAANAGGLLK